MKFEVDQPRSYPDAVVDERETPYRLASMLGQGGQGAVFRTRDNGIAVKLIYEKEAIANDRIKLMRSRLQKINARQLWRRPISRPLVVLKAKEHDGGSFIGYVMQLLDETEPLSVIAEPGSDITDADQLFAWYNATGGLRRRLVLLASAAETLAWLNGVPLVYADPSPNNILIPQNLAGEEVWLIDPDNIGVVESDSPEATPQALSFVTDRYAAPEVMGGARVSTLSDSFAFSVIAFQTLTARHPYVGDVVDDGSVEALAEAFAGKLPWVDDPDRDSNRCTRGIFPREQVLHPRLWDLAHRAFGPGRDQPLLRPGLGLWADALRYAADQTLPCRCGATFYPYIPDEEDRNRSVLQNECPWCDKPRDGFAIMQLHTWVAPISVGPGDPVWRGGVPEGQDEHQHAIIPTGGFRLTRRHVLAGSIFERNETVVEVSYQPDGLAFKPAAVPIQMWTGAPGSPRFLANPDFFKWRDDPDDYIGPVHFGPPDQDHRVAFFFNSPAP
jgi:DNA-binding helix-hairpin-helix protein with protein kinase domain